MSTRRRRQSRACTGRSFSMNGTDGYMAHLMDFMTRPNVNGSTQAITTIDYTTSNFYLPAHGYSNGQAVVLTGTTAPTGLALSTSLAFPLNWTTITEYWIIKVDVNNFKLASSHYLAMLGTNLPFSSNGTSVSVTALGGGANWYLADDYSRQVAQTFANSAVNTTTHKITATAHGFAQMQRVTIASSGTLPSPLVAGTAYWIVRFDSSTIGLADSEAHAFANTLISISTQGTGNHTITTSEHFIIVCDTAAPTPNGYDTVGAAWESPTGMAPKFLKLGYQTTESGYVRMQGLIYWDSTNHIPWGYWSGVQLASYDSSVFAYQFCGGDEYLMQATLLGATWSAIFIDTFTGISSKLEVVSKVGVLQSGITAGSNVTMQLGTGQAANFTANKWYYIYDFNAHCWVNYGYVVSVNIGADTIVFSNVAQNFPSGSILTPYAHRFYSYGAVFGNLQETNMRYYGNGSPCQIAYCSSSVQANVFHSQIVYINGAANYIISNELVASGIPDDEGNYDCVRHALSENRDFGGSTTNSINRLYGTSNNTLCTYTGTMGMMTNYRTMLGVDYLNFMIDNGNYSGMVTYSESAS